ncbi:MAG: hypothetical protein Kow0077_07030 [Anaerolineae bacterium]
MYTMRVKPFLNLVGDRLHALPILVLYLTDGCNSKCVMCDIWRSPRRNMDMALVQSLVEAVPRLGIRWVVLSGGEAMQHPQWAQIGRMFKQAGAYVMLLTNGLLLQRDAALAAESVDEVIVSLDAGTPATYRAIRGVDAFALVLDGMRAVGRTGVPVVTRTTVQRLNFREVPAIIEQAGAAGASRVSFLPVDAHSPEAFGMRSIEDAVAANRMLLDAAEVEQLEALLHSLPIRFAEAFASGLLAESPRKLLGLVDYFRARLGQGALERPRCNAPHVSAVVEVDGRLRPCYFLPVWGKLDGRDLRNALNDDDALALRRAYRKGERSECEGCVCSLYKGPRALFQMYSAGTRDARA